MPRAREEDLSDFLHPSELETYFGEGSSKGQKLPRGLQNVDDIEVSFSVKERKEQET